MFKRVSKISSQVTFGNFLIKILGNCIRSVSVSVLTYMANFKILLEAIVGLFGFRPKQSFDKNLLWFLRIVSRSVLKNNLYFELKNKVGVDLSQLNFALITKQLYGLKNSAMKKGSNGGGFS